MLNDLQGGNQLAVGKGRAPSFIRQGCQGANHRLVALEVTEIALHAPNGHQGLAINAIALFDPLQDVAVLDQQCLALAYPYRGQRAIQVFPDGAGEFRLAAVGLDHAHIRGDPGEGAVEYIGANPGAQGFGAERVHPFIEGLSGLDVQIVDGQWCDGGRCGKGGCLEVG